MQAVLVMFRSDGQRRSFSLSRDIIVIGRREDCDLRIPLGEVSRKHCRLIRDGESLRLEDLGSSNGTYHNGQRIQEASLSPGDSIQVGPVVFVLQIDGVPADDELNPVMAQPAAEPAAAEAGEAGASQATGAGHEVATAQELGQEEGLESLESLEPLQEDDGFDVVLEEAQGSQQGQDQLEEEHEKSPQH